MTTQYRSELAALRSAAGSPVDLQRVQDSLMRQSLEQMRSALSDTKTFMHAFAMKMECRTAVLSPTKNFSDDVHQRRLECSSRSVTQPQFGSSSATTLPLRIPSSLLSQAASGSQTSTGVYSVNTHSHSEAIIHPLTLNNPEEPQTSGLIDLVLPPPLAFTEPSKQRFILFKLFSYHARYNLSDSPQLFWPPELGQRAVSWDWVYALIRQPKLLWECWRPHALDSYASVEVQWIAYNTGESVVDDIGAPVGVKMPLRQVEQFFKHKWRDTTTVCKCILS